MACISPGWKRQRRELYVLPLRQPLLVVPIPLRERESPVKLDLQALVEQVYETGRYDDLGYRTDLDPPLTGEDAAWAEVLLKAAGRRRRRRSLPWPLNPLVARAAGGADRVRRESIVRG